MELVEKIKQRVRIERDDCPAVVAQGFVKILRELGIQVDVVAQTEEYLELLIDKSR